MKNYSTYVLDNCSVHIMLKVKAALLKKGYVYIGIVGEVAESQRISK